MHYRDSVRFFLWSDFKWLLFWVVSFAILGGMLGQPIVGVVVGLIVFIIRQWQALYLLHRWVRFHSTEDPPEVNGVLSDLSQSFYTVHKREMRLHEALLSNVRRVRESVSALSEAIVLIDSKSQIEWWNPAAESMLGLKHGDQGKHILNLIRQPEFVSYYQDACFDESLHMNSWVNNQKSYDCKITPFGDNEKILIVHDISHLNKLEQMRKDFIANVSHELRTPLTVFSGYIETFMAQEGLNPAWQRGLGQMQQQAFRMNNIVNDLLMLSRLENEKNQAQDDCVDMPDLLSELFDEAQAYNKDYGHLIHLNIDAQQSLKGSRSELRSALSNLVFNAIKYTPKNGNIYINWQLSDRGAVFSVVDSGIGIAPEHIGRLTERFYRVDSGRSRDTGGTGLGLAIVKHVLHRHDATLQVDSKVGKGSTFSAVFPRSRLSDV